MHAEQAYLFRHAVLRDAAYQLQLPGDRARLHRLTYELLEQLANGMSAEAAGAIAFDLAGHAFNGQFDSQSEIGRLQNRELYWLHRAHSWCERRFQNERGCEVLDRIAEHPASDIRGSCRAMRLAATIRHHLGNSADARRQLESSAKRARDAGDVEEESRALKNLTDVLVTTGDAAGAVIILNDLLARRDVIANPAELGKVFDGLGMAYRQLNRLDDAERSFSQALAIWREHPDKSAEAVSRSNYSLLLKRLGRLADSERELRSALALHKALGNRRSEGIVLFNLAGVLQERGKKEEALELYFTALAIMREVGSRRIEAMVLGDLAAALERLI